MNGRAGVVTSVGVLGPKIITNFILKM
jgi:hypothetical protein